jgi:hypothetical protein
LGRDEGSLRPSGWVGRQRRSSIEEGRGRRLPTEGEAAIAGALELCRDMFIRTHNGRGAVPGATARSDQWIGGIGQSLVNVTPFGRARRMVDRGPNEGVPKPYLVPDLNQPCGFGNGRGIGPNTQ